MPASLDTPVARPRELSYTKDGHTLLLQRISSAKLPTAFGEFRVTAYHEEGATHLALVVGEVAGKERVLTRVHSECLTGDALGSLRCDCGEQLHDAMRRVHAAGFGVVLYLRQEGRGIGLANKVRAYHLQDQGFDTVAANRHLGFPADSRDFQVAALILHDLQVASVEVLTNNPRKIRSLRAHGIRVESRLPLQALPNIHNRAYLEAKRDQMGHELTL